MRKAIAAAVLASSFVVTTADGAVSADMTTPPGSTASINVTITISTALGTSTDSDAKTIATTGTMTSAFLPDAPAFTATQMNAMTINFANTTFNFQFFCLPFIGCQNLNVTMNNLVFTLVEPNCSPITAGTGAVSFANAQVHAFGNYSTSGITVTSGTVDSIGSGSMTGRITNPAAGAVKLDQVAMASQTFVVDPADLPPGVTALTIVIQPTLTNTTFSGPFALNANDFDFDDDGVFDFCDTCTDTDSDGFGNPNFVHNTCAVDNCPEVFNPDQLDTNGNGIGDACKPPPPCPQDIVPKGGNGTVDVDDLLLVINSWGACVDCPADISPAPNGNDTVDVDDLLAVINAWGVCE